LLVVIPDVPIQAAYLSVTLSAKNKIVFRAENFDSACEWLGEDEYEQVEARIFPDDGWPLTTAGFKL
jgi:hypothetical protein